MLKGFLIRIYVICILSAVGLLFIANYFFECCIQKSEFPISNIEMVRTKPALDSWKDRAFLNINPQLADTLHYQMYIPASESKWSRIKVIQFSLLILLSVTILIIVVTLPVVCSALHINWDSD